MAKSLTNKNKLSIVKPNVASEWHPMLNGDLTPDKVTYASVKKVWWQCSKQHPPYLMSISGRTRKERNNCPYCNYKKVCKDNCLAETHPNIAAEWDYENNELTPSEVTGKSTLRVTWIAECGHRWETRITDRTSDNTKCPYCFGLGANKKIDKFNSFGSKYPQLLNEWDYEFNVIDPYAVTHSSHLKVHWICSKNPHHKWVASLNHRTHITNSRGCPFCTNQSVDASNCLETLYPALSKEWDYEKNGNLTPRNVVAGSHRYVQWKCEKGHSWKAKIVQRTRAGSNCPYCAGKKACKENCLETLYPEISLEWNFTRNLLEPSDVVPFSAKKVWWICKTCGHEWEATIANRTFSKSGCPKCKDTTKANDTFVSEVTSFYGDEYTPLSQYVNDKTKVKVRHNVCGDEWEIRPSSFLSGVGCPRCRDSKGEREITRFLKTHRYRFKREYKFPDCKNIVSLPFDFAVFNVNGLLCLIEYQGELHYEQAGYFGGEEKLKRQQINDNIKRKYCKKRGIPLIEVPYWEFENLEKYLNEQFLMLKVKTAP